MWSIIRLVLTPNKTINPQILAKVYDSKTKNNALETDENGWYKK